MPISIGLLGNARTGKDSFAEPIIQEYGFELLNLGTVIKGFFQAYIASEISAGDLLKRMQEANPALTGKELDSFFRNTLLPFEEADIICDSFTEYDPHKSAIRPILELGGELMYPVMLEEYFRLIDAKFSAGKNVISTRVSRLAEIEAWQKRRAILIEIVKPERGPVSAWEANTQKEARESGAIDFTLYNVSTLEEWQTTARQTVKHILSVMDAI